MAWVVLGMVSVTALVLWCELVVAARCSRAEEAEQVREWIIEEVERRHYELERYD